MLCQENLQLVKRQTIAEEINSLAEGRPVKGQSKLASLLPVLVEGTEEEFITLLSPSRLTIR